MSLNIRTALLVVSFAMTPVFQVAAVDDSQARLGKAAAVFNKLTDSSRPGIKPEQIAKADCVAVIPGFKKGAAAVGVGLWPGICLLPQRRQLVGTRAL
jgi:hypothetical protein